MELKPDGIGFGGQQPGAVRGVYLVTITPRRRSKTNGWTGWMEQDATINRRHDDEERRDDLTRLITTAVPIRLRIKCLITAS